jgi:transposase
MMGQQLRTESLFYYFRLEDQISEDHLLRLMDRYVDLRFVRERLKGLYSSTGRPSIDPEVLLRLLLVGYLYGITSERRLLEEVRMHLAYRWFTRLGFEQGIPDIRRFPKIGTDVFGSLFGRCSRKSCDGVWRQAWLKVRIWRWMGPWWEPMQADRVESRESS